MGMKIPPYSYEYIIPYNQVQSSEQTKKKVFANFIESRIQYLNNLRNLGDNWSSGKSLQPTSESINNGISLLRNLMFWFNNSIDPFLISPKIVIGPSPNGGIGIMIAFSEVLKMYVSILNSEFNCEIETHGLFEDFNLDTNNMLSTFTYLNNLNSFNNHERRYYTQRRNIV
jgi:hypothetical protein